MLGFLYVKITILRTRKQSNSKQPYDTHLQIQFQLYNLQLLLRMTAQTGDIILSLNRVRTRFHERLR